MADAQIAALQAEIESLKTEAAVQQVSSEQALHDLASKLSEVESSLEAERATTVRTSAEKEQSQKRVGELEQELKKAAEKHASDSTKEKESIEKEQEREREARKLLEALDRSKVEKEDVEAQLSSLRTLHSTLQADHSKLEASLLEASTTARSATVRLETANSSIASLTSSKEYLTSELNLVRSQAAASRRESLEQLTTVQGQLEASQLEARETKASLDDLRVKYDSLKKRHEEVATELQRVKEESGVRESQFVAEMGSMRRLVDGMEKREETRKARLDEVEKGVEEERRARQEREDELLENLREERERGDNLDLRCQELREAVERGAANFRGSLSGESDFSLSPEAAAASRGQRKGRSYAEIYAEYVRMQEELFRERAEVKRLGECLTQILGDIEERAPVLKEQREEYERLSLEATSLATQLAEALSDRDAADRRSAALQLDIDRLKSEAAITSSQLADLGRQLRTLLRSVAPPSTIGNPDDFDESEAEILARAEVSNDTDSVVSAHLVTFKSINDLQVQNQKLLRITRELGSQMEKAEDVARTRRREEENTAVVEAHELVLRLKEEVESQRVTLEAQGRERDMLRKMLAIRTEAGMGANGVSHAANGTSGEGSGDSARLGEVEATFEAYRTEIAVDTQRLRDDLAAAQKDAGAVRTDLAKSRAQAEYTTERLRLLTESYDLQKRELVQMSTRSQQLQQNSAKQDMATHKLTEEALELRSANDQLRHENTNLKSEREVWKSVESRLIEENSSLGKERSHLADLMRNLQTMQNELERSATDSRRRLDEQVLRLEAQTSELRDRLAAEQDSVRQHTLRKELDSRLYQERIDKLTAEHQITRESLVSATTSKEHLEQRISDLTLQLTSKEEKLAIFEGRTSVAGGSERTHEEQLEVTVAELRAEVRTLKSSLERANANVQQFQAIAETEGESLRQVTATYDEYKLSTERVVAEKDVEINGLRERLHSLTTELTTAGTQNSDLHRQIETERVAFEKDRKALEDAMAALRSNDQTAREAQLAAQDDLRRQAQLAREAHDKYDRELVAHAEDVKRLSQIKDELDAVRTTVQEYQTQREVAIANLSASETSWNLQKTQLKQEISDLQKRTSDLDAQNALLHTHLESLGSQTARLQQQHAGSGTDGATQEGDAVASANSTSVEELRGVIRYIRSEREILDLQLEFSKQETARLQHQLEVSNRSLDESRQALSEERNKMADSTSASAQHAELLERIQTAKLLRESNQTLRDENEASLRKAVDLDNRLKQALAELEPLKQNVLTLQAELEAKDSTIKLLQEDNDRWRVRNQTILAKYERIDPEELQVLKDEVASFQTRLSSAEKEKEELQAKVAEAQGQADGARTRFQTLQARARDLRDETVKLREENKTLQETLAQKATEGSQQEQSFSAFADEKQALEAQISEHKATSEARLAEKTALEARLAEEVALREAQAKLIEEKTAELATVESQRARLATRERPIFEDNKRMKLETKTLTAEIEQLKKDFVEKNAEAIETAVQARMATLPPSGDQNAVEETIKTRLAEAQAIWSAERDAAIAKAVTTSTAKLEADLAAAQSQLKSASSATVTDSSPDMKQLKSDFEASKLAMQAEFDQTKAKLQEEATAREKDITDRLTAEIGQLKDAASKATTSDGTVSSVDVDSLVLAKLKESEPERDAALKKAVEEALAESDAKHKTALEEVKVQAERQSQLKNTLLAKKVDALSKKLAAASGGASAVPNPEPSKTTPSAPATTTKTPASEAGTPGVITANAPPAPAASNRGGATAGGIRGRGGVALRGGRGGTAARGGAATTTPAAPATAGLSLRGAAGGGRGGVAARGRGGMLAAITAANAAGTPPKRQRDDESTPSDSTDAAKRQKQEDSSS
ncbi:hypothetical protein T439DRAFT_300397 [Meredithblackwellia eburnea MCA 4105]